MQSVGCCSEQILEQKKRALLAKEALEEEHVRRAEEERRQREAARGQVKARRTVEAQRAQQRAELDLQQKTAYFKVCCTQPQPQSALSAILCSLKHFLMTSQCSQCKSFL